MKRYSKNQEYFRALFLFKKSVILPRISPEMKMIDVLGSSQGEIYAPLCIRLLICTQAV